MHDRRAWIISSLIVLLSLGAYILWITRPRAGYTARSLTAPPPKPATKTLHIDGCVKDFIVKPGELVEPRAVPGAPLDHFRSVYGKETRRQDRENITWRQNAFTLTEGYYGPESLGNYVNIAVNQGHVVQTLDDIELGIDSVGTVFRKLRDRKIEAHERIDGPEGNWMLTVSFFSACGRKYRSEYSVLIPGSPQTDNSIAGPANSPQNGGKPWRSDVFMNKIVYQYSLVPSGGHDDSPDGSPSEHN